MSKNFVVNVDTIGDFKELFPKFLKSKYHYNKVLADNISEVAMNLASFYGIEYLQIICDAISSCKYTLRAEKGMFPEYESKFNKETGEITRSISLPINSDVDSPYAREYILLPTIELVNSYKNEYLNVDGNIKRRRGVMYEDIETKEKTGESLQKEIERYIHWKIVKTVISPEENVKIEPISSNDKNPDNAFYLLDGSLGLDELTRECLLSGDGRILKEEFEKIFGDNTYDYFKENSHKMEPQKTGKIYIETISQMQEKNSKKIA